MNNPLKVIFKYKNSSGAIQYNPYIFIGNIDTAIQSILNKFTKLPFITTLKTLSKSDIKTLQEFYGSSWYKFFFIYNHLEYSIKNISSSDKKIIQSKLGKDWTSKHLSKYNLQSGGDKENEESDSEDNDDTVHENKDNLDENMDDGDLYEEEEQEKNDELESEGNIKELKEKKQQNKVLDTLIKKSDIKDKKGLTNILSFDSSKNNNFKSEELSEVYNKIYVKLHYIYDDDNILTIKRKICASIINDKVINNDSYILPSRQYFYSQYLDNSQIKTFMIGHRFLKKDELFDIINPVSLPNLDYYYNKNKKTEYIKDLMSLNLIKLEDNNDVILHDINQYIVNNEIFMIDIYHELFELKDYNEINENQIQNLYDTYIKLYFPTIKKTDILQIVNYLNNKSSPEYDIIKINYNKINLELFTKTKPFDIYSNTITNYDTFKYFKNLYITIASIKINIQTDPIDLYLIFENFELTKTIPFMRYHSKNHKSFVKFYTNVSKKEKDFFLKWIENTPVGISIKIFLEKYKKYVTLKIYESGRIEYITQWKEDENITIQDVEETYPTIIGILKNIKRVSGRIKLKIPTVDDFNIEFINAIQTFDIPGNKNINYNIFQVFAKYFFPMISYVSQGENESNKHGAHLIYKRVSKYQQNLTKRIENNIADILRNYEYTQENLIQHVVTQLNISRDDAIKEIDNIKSKYRFYKKKGNKKNKKIDQLPKYKQPGINITIQGTQSDKQVIRISGCRGKFLLNKIILFMSVFIFLFIELILLNKYPAIKKQLEAISKIALKMDDVVVIKDSVSTRSNIKRLVDLDKERFGFTPNPGKSNYSRMCLKEYQPLGFTSKNLDKLRAMGYVYDEKEQNYIYKSKSTKKRKNKYIHNDVVLKAVKLKNKSTGEDIYYVCHPKVNKNKYQFISFQDLSKHPQKMCMPCCNKQNQLESNKPNIRNRYLQCNSQVVKDKNYTNTENILYISKDSNKLTPNRYGLLPSQLDLFLNTLLSKKMILKDTHFLEETTPTYFLKYGMEQNTNSFLNSVGHCLNLTYDQIIKDIKSKLKKDTNEQFFIYLYGGRIKLLFDNAENYIKYIETFEQIDYSYLIDILCYLYNINIFVYKRKFISVDIDDNTTSRIDEIVLDCHLDYNIDDFTDKKRKNIILLQENNYFNPVFEVQKEGNVKNIRTRFLFSYKESNVIEHIMSYYNTSCLNKIGSSDIQNNITNIAINLYKELTSQKNSDYKPIYQIIDNNYKCTGFVLKNNFLINIVPSKTINNLQYIQMDKKQKYIKSFQDTYNYLVKLSKIIDSKFEYKPSNVLYSDKKSNKYHIKYIKCLNNLTIEIIPQLIDEKTLKKMNLYATFFYITNEKIDYEILQGKNNILFDERSMNIKENEYNSESYELLRLEFSNYLSKNTRVKNIVEKIINDSDSGINDKLYKTIENILKGSFNISSTKLSAKELKSYSVNNKRLLCENQKEDICKIAPHCNYYKNKCSFIMQKDMLNLFTNKLVDELLNNPLKKSELLQIDDYYVSNIVNREIFTERNKQQIIREDTVSFKKTLYNVFGKDADPIIGKKINKINLLDKTYIELNEQNKLNFYKTYFIQNIKVNDNTLFRAYANGFFWIKNSYENIEYRNLGYFHPLQTDLSNYMRSITVENLLKLEKDPAKNKLLEKFVKNIKQYSYNLYKYPKLYTIAIPELLALQMQYPDIPIYIYDYNYTKLYILDNVNIVYDYNKKNKVHPKYNEPEFKEKCIHLKFTLLPSAVLKIINIEIMYYIKEKKSK